MYQSNHVILYHKFVSGKDLLNLYRELRDVTLPFGQKLQEKIKNFGINLLFEGKHRFPEHELYYDLEGSLLGIVYNDLRSKLYTCRNLKDNDVVQAKFRYEKTLNELYQVMNMHKIDPMRGYYNRECFERHFDLRWKEMAD